MNITLVKSLAKATVLITAIVVQKIVISEIVKETFKD